MTGTGSRPLLIAHRGDKAGAPENTLAAVRSALAAGVDLIEVDVRVTADGQAVLLHDRDLSKTTDGHGLVEDLTYDEVRRLDAGSWFGDRFVGEPVPLLSDALDLTAGRVRLNVDVKTAAAIPAVSELLLATGRGAEVVISGCPASWVRRFRATSPGATVLLNLDRWLRLVARLRWRWLLRHWLAAQARRPASTS